MRLLHCIPNFLSGGAQQQLSYLAAEQRRSGHEVHVAYLHAGPKLTLVASTGVEIHRFAARGNHEPGLFREVYRLIRRLGPDVVQTWLLQMDVVAGLASRLRRRPWVLTERASAPAYSGWKSAARVAIARHADAVVSNSALGDAYWSTRVGPSVLRRVVPNAVPVEKIRGVAPVPDSAISLPEGHRLVLYAGRLSPQKNLEVLVTALGALTARLPVTAYLCGDGTHEAETRAVIARSALQDSVRMVGYVEDVWGWMKKADVFISVSHFEGHPNTVLEAAASGCPLVLSDIPEHRRMLDDSQAVFVDRSSPTAIADALERLLREPAEARRRADAARLAVASLSVDAMARGYEDVYEEILARRGKKTAR